MNFFRRKRRALCTPWDGQHTLHYVLFEQFFGNRPDDYCNGWVWKCACGTGTALPTRYAYTEQLAAAEFIEHARTHQELKEATK